MPTTDVTVSFGGALCAAIPAPTYTATYISCSLANAPRAGTHKSKVRVPSGLLPFASGVSDIKISLTVSSVTPNIVNPLGGAIITITGTGFPMTVDKASVTFSDKTGCLIQSITDTQIVCKM